MEIIIPTTFGWDMSNIIENDNSHKNEMVETPDEDIIEILNKTGGFSIQRNG